MTDDAKFAPQALTFDDVLLLPAHSAVLPAEADTVKRSEAGMITDPVTCGPDATVADVEALCARYRISGLPVTDDDGVLLGIVTNRDIRFEADHSRSVSATMTPMPLVTAPVGVSREDALGLLCLLFDRQVAVQHAHAALPGHGHRHPRLGDRVHGRGDQRHPQFDPAAEPGGGIGVRRGDRRVGRHEQHIVESQRLRCELGVVSHGTFPVAAGIHTV